MTESTQESSETFYASPLTISTCTVITSINAKISLDYVTRFVDIYYTNAPELELKSGGLYNLESYGNCARGETLLDKIKDEFNNQSTVKFKYWGFRNTNVKLFANGKLQMTGPKYQEEGDDIAACIIEIIKKVKITINTDIHNIIPLEDTTSQSIQNNDLQLVYDTNSKNVTYYRKAHDRFLRNYKMDLDKIYQDIINDEISLSKQHQESAEPNSIAQNTHENISDTNIQQSHNVISNIISETTHTLHPTDNGVNTEGKSLPPITPSDIVHVNMQVNNKSQLRRHKNGVSVLDGFHFDIVNNKIFEMGIHDIYEDSLVPRKYKLNDNLDNNLDNSLDLDSNPNDKIKYGNLEFLIKNNWYSDYQILTIIDKLELIKVIFHKEYEQIIRSSKNLDELYINIITIGKKYLDFEFKGLNSILRDIDENIYPSDEQTLKDVKYEVFKYDAMYQKLLNKKIGRLVMIRNIDVSICNTLTKYIAANPHILTTQSPWYIPLEKIELFTNRISKPHEYKVNGTHTVMINSDLTVNFNINLKKMSKILKKKGLFNTYEPDEHSGVNMRYYHNPNNTNQGYCNCDPHCSTKEKRSICTKVTVLIFRPGSIIITGARNIEQLREVHKLIVSILKECMHLVKMNDNPEDNKHVALLNNEFRKISKKTRLFYIKKQNIITN